MGDLARGAVSMLTAVAVGILQLGVAISLAALIFAGDLSAGVGRGAAGFLLGSAIVSLVLGVTSAMPTVTGGAQDTAGVIMAAVAASIASTTAPDQQVATVIVMIALCALVTGAVFVGLGVTDRTKFVRYLPWPVITGFTAGTGWLLFRGGIEVMRGAPIEFAELPELFEADTAKLIMPGLAIALVVVAILRSRINNTVVSALFLASIGIFHLIARRSSSVAELEAEGWLFGPFPDNAGWQPLSPSDLSEADWGVLFTHVLPIIAVVAVSVIGVLLNLSGLEAILETEIELSDEVRNAGLANLAVGATGGLVGWHLIGDTALARRLGARGRLVPIVVAVMAFGAFLLGPGLVGLVPRMVAGGVLAALGLSLLLEWATTTMPALNRTDRWLSGGILAAIAIFGVLPGVALGVLVATVVFLMRYSRIDPARHVIDAAGRSTVDRDITASQYLRAKRRSVLAIELQGFLFFGSMGRLRSLVSERGISGGQTQTEFLVIDTARVTGLDSTAASGLAALARQLNDQGIHTVWSSLTDEIAGELQANDIQPEPRLPDLDHAIAWCEEQLLDAASISSDATVPPIVSPALAQRMTQRTLAPGETLIHQGDDSRELFVVVSGRLTAWVVGSSGRRTRLREIRAGSLLGEVAFCRGAQRTADVVAESAVEVLAMTRERFDELRSESPELAAELDEVLLRQLADRVAKTSAVVGDLLS